MIIKLNIELEIEFDELQEVGIINGPYVVELMKDEYKVGTEVVGGDLEYKIISSEVKLL